MEPEAGRRRLIDRGSAMVERDDSGTAAALADLAMVAIGAALGAAAGALITAAVWLLTNHEADDWSSGFAALGWMIGAGVVGGGIGAGALLRADHRRQPVTTGLLTFLFLALAASISTIGRGLWLLPVLAPVAGWAVALRSRRPRRWEVAAHDSARPARLDAGVWLVLAVLAASATTLAYATRPDWVPDGAACATSESRLVRAAARGEGAEVRRLLDAGAAADALDAHAHTPLFCAADAGADDAAEALADRGATLDRLSRAADGTATETPIAGAVRRAHWSTARLLAARGADIGVRLSDTEPALAKVVRADQLDLLGLLIDHGADLDDAGDGHTWLFVAAADATDARVIELLLAKGADPSRASFVSACLDLAPEVSDPVMLVVTPSPMCGLPVAEAARTGHVEILTALLDAGAPTTDAVYAATLAGRPDVVKLLLGRGVEPGGSPDRTSPLLASVIFDRTDIRDQLLAVGADPNLGGPAAASALRAAAPNLHLAEVFAGAHFSDSQEASASAVACALRGRAANLPPLIVAVTLGHADSVEALLAHGADPGAVASFAPPLTAVDAAATIGDRVAHDRLVAAGASPVAAVAGSPRPETARAASC